MRYRIELKNVDPNTTMADQLDELSASHEGVVEFDEENEEDFINFLDQFAGDVGDAFSEMTITKVE